MKVSVWDRAKPHRTQQKHSGTFKGESPVISGTLSRTRHLHKWENALHKTVCIQSPLRPTGHYTHAGPPPAVEQQLTPALLQVQSHGYSSRVVGGTRASRLLDTGSGWELKAGRLTSIGKASRVRQRHAGLPQVCSQAARRADSQRATQARSEARRENYPSKKKENIF